MGRPLWILPSRAPCPHARQPIRCGGPTQRYCAASCAPLTAHTGTLTAGAAGGARLSNPTVSVHFVSPYAHGCRLMKDARGLMPGMLAAYRLAYAWRIASTFNVTTMSLHRFVNLFYLSCVRARRFAGGHAANGRHSSLLLLNMNIPVFCSALPRAYAVCSAALYHRHTAARGGAGARTLPDTPLRCAYAPALPLLLYAFRWFYRTARTAPTYYAYAPCTRLRTTGITGLVATMP